jgi:hypothetical protein
MMTFIAPNGNDAGDGQLGALKEVGNGMGYGKLIIRKPRRHMIPKKLFVVYEMFLT